VVRQGLRQKVSTRTMPRKNRVFTLFGLKWVCFYQAEAQAQIFVLNRLVTGYFSMVIANQQQIALALPHH